MKGGRKVGAAISTCTYLFTLYQLPTDSTVYITIRYLSHFLPICYLLLSLQLDVLGTSSRPPFDAAFALIRFFSSLSVEMSPWAAQNVPMSHQSQFPSFFQHSKQCLSRSPPSPRFATVI